MVLATGVSLLLAACQSTNTDAIAPRDIEHELFLMGSAPPPSPTFTWSHAGPVEILGVGMGNWHGATQNPAEVVIGDLDSAIAVRVQVAVKYGRLADPTSALFVEFRNRDGDLLESVAWADSKTAVTGDFFEATFALRGPHAVSLPDGILRAEVVGGEIVTSGGEPFSTPRSFVAFVLRDDLTPSVTSKGATPYADVYHHDVQEFVQSHVETMTFDPAAEPRPLRVDFAMSELDGDDRVIDVIVRVDGVAVYDVRWSQPNRGEGLVIDGVSTTLPAGATDVEIELFSPDPTPGPEGDSVWLAGVNASVTEGERGVQGCTPGYWRNHSTAANGNQADAWIPTGFTGDQRFGDPLVFDHLITISSGGKGQPVQIDDPTLLEAVVAAGGGTSALARHAVAALLNAAHPDVNAYYTVEEVVQMVQDALDGVGPLDIEDTKDLFAQANELGCPL
ncbi:MAG: hypothetical protein P1P87_06170 [Trueperaceae bacterium]|nr:hypothetical protein [Trueperaceae bacterium]